MNRIADMLECCAREIEDAEGRCSYCVGGWTAILGMLAACLRDNATPPADFVDRRRPARSDAHGARCRLHTRIDRAG